MNLAIGTFLVLILLVPGAIFRRFYYNAQFSKQYLKPSFVELVLSGFVLSLLIHFIGFMCCELIGRPWDIEVILNLLAGGASFDESAQRVSSHFNLILSYNLLVWLFSAILGVVSHKVIRLAALDQRFKLLRFSNYWHYVFFGEFTNFPRSSIRFNNSSSDEIEGVFVDALIETKEGTILYEGILVDYELTKDGSLDCIYLHQSQRRRLSDDPCPSSVEDHSSTNEPPIHYEIPGFVLVIPYSKILNLNLTYWKIEVSDDPSTDEVEHKIVILT